MLRTRDNVLGGFARREITDIGHELLGDYVNIRRWVPFDQWYDTEGSIGKLNILLS